MEKPLTLKIQDFKRELYDIINKSHLHPYILLNELNNVAIEIQNQDNMEIEEYNKSLKGSEEKCKK